jgi:hypothetical protein
MGFAYAQPPLQPDLWRRAIHLREAKPAEQVKRGKVLLQHADARRQAQSSRLLQPPMHHRRPETATLYQRQQRGIDIGDAIAPDVGDDSSRRLARDFDHLAAGNFPPAAWSGIIAMSAALTATNGS